MTVRRNPITGEPVLFAPARALRPHAFDDRRDRDERCPFCPGHEEDTPPAIAVHGEPWSVRVFPNKYPPVEGAEVIVESPRHDARFADLDDARLVVAVYRDRLRAHRTATWASLFRNEGRRAGASIDHLHSQIVPLPFLPRRILEETEGFRSMKRCPLCFRDGAVVVDEGTWFLRVAPLGSRMPYQQWILPKRHVESATALEDREVEDLAQLLRSCARTTAKVAEAYNWSFMNFEHEAGHFYVDVLPRLATIAGLELGAGTFVQIVDPAEAARRLRD